MGASGSSRSTRWLIAGLLGGWTLAGTVVMAQEDGLVVDFESADANRSGSPSAPAITDQFEPSHGVVFPRGVTPLVFDEESFPPQPDLPRSGSTVITTCYGAEFCSNEIVIELTRPVVDVTVWAGYSSSLSEPAVLVMEAFDRTGELIDDDVALFEPSDTAHAADTSLSVGDGLGRIAALVVRWDDPTRFFSQLILDDLELTPFEERRDLTPVPDLLVLDGTDGPVEDVIEFVNTGNVAIPIGSVGIGPDADAFALRDTDCVGVLDVDESCVAIVLYDPGVAAPAAAAVTVDERAGPTVVVVSVEGFVETAPPETTEPPPVTTDPPVATTVPPDPPDDDDRWQLLVGAGLIGGGLVAGATVIARRARPRRPTATVHVRAGRWSGGRIPTGALAIGVRWAPGGERLTTNDAHWEVLP